jgi:hypothetical protein
VLLAQHLLPLLLSESDRRLQSPSIGRVLTLYYKYHPKFESLQGSTRPGAQDKAHVNIPEKGHARYDLVGLLYIYQKRDFPLDPETCF